MSCCFQIDRVDEGRAESAETEVGREVKPRARSVGGGGDVCGAKTLTCVGFFFKTVFGGSCLSFPVRINLRAVSEALTHDQIR